MVNIFGDLGNTGSQGERGPIGPPGPSGTSGTHGKDGPQGKRGPVGKTGLSGISGEVGPPGERGPVGESGPSGISGEVGPPGERGPVGESGPSGISGKDGSLGERGPVGLVGVAGKDGVRGPQGRTGQQGERGLPSTTDLSAWIPDFILREFRKTESCSYFFPKDGSGFKKTIHGIEKLLSHSTNPIVSPDDGAIHAIAIHTPCQSTVAIPYRQNRLAVRFDKTNAYKAKGVKLSDPAHAWVCVCYIPCSSAVRSIHS